MKRALLLLLVIVACRSSDHTQPEKKPPLSPALKPETLVAANCTACHGADVLSQQRLTEKQWAASVKKMQGWGALVEEKQQPALVHYLATTYATGSFKPSEATDVLAAIEPTEDGTFGGGSEVRGKTLYAQICAACHGSDARGNTIGVNLVDRYLLYRAEDFATIVRAGRGRMPASALPTDQIADLLAWLRTLRADS